MNKNLAKVKGIKREKGIVKKDISNRDLALGVTGMMVGL